MGDVTPINRHPTMEGEARCTQCGHCWEGVAPVGTIELECPQCHAMRGVFIYPIDPPLPEVWQCGCGGDLFYVGKQAIVCARCGTTQLFEGD